MIETLTHRDMSSRLVSFLMVLCRDFGVASEKELQYLRLTSSYCWSHWFNQSNNYKIIGDFKDSGLLNIESKKITVFDPIALAKDLIESSLIMMYWLNKILWPDFNCFFNITGGLIAPFGDLLGTKIGK